MEGNGGRAEEGGGVGAADIGGVEEPRRWARRCFHCHRTPCMFSAHQEAMVRYANHLDRRRKTMLLPGGKVHDAFLRKYMYQHFVMLIEDSPLGWGNRVRLPMCVVSQVRKRFPKKRRGGYMGHRGMPEEGFTRYTWMEIGLECRKGIGEFRAGSRG